MTILIIVGIIVLLGIIFASMYNSLVKLRNNRENAFADIDVQLKQRHDLIPQLVDTVKGYAAHEKETANKRQIMTTKPHPEIDVTQEMRQVAFDNWETTDDHGMVIYGIAKDQNGKEYFMVKNSWGKSGKYNGIWYASKAFVAYKTMNILVHKDALPKEIAKKLGIK